MKFTALEEYGLRCMLQLAKKSLDTLTQGRLGELGELGEPQAASPQAALALASLTLGEVAEEEGLTQQYAGKIFRILARSGLVESERGRNGGYRLTRHPEFITVSEVLVALGGKFFERKLCGRYRGGFSGCVHTSNCAIRWLWMEVQCSVDQVLTKCTLRDLVVRERTMKEALRALPDELSRPSAAGLEPTTLVTSREGSTG